MVMMGPNKKKLHRAVAAIDERLRARLGGHIKGDWQVFPVDSRGISFVGYRFRHTHTRLRHKAFLRFTRQCRKIGRGLKEGRPPSFHAAASVLSRAGGLKHADCVQARKRYFGPLDKRAIKDVVRGRVRHEPSGNHSAV